MKINTSLSKSLVNIIVFNTIADQWFDLYNNNCKVFNKIFRPTWYLFIDEDINTIEAVIDKCVYYCCGCLVDKIYDN